MTTPISLTGKRAEVDGTSAKFKPLIEFPDRDGFVLGYEAGLLFGRLDAKPEKWSGTYHAENADLLRDTAKACGYDVKIEPSGDATWVFAEFRKRPRLKPAECVECEKRLPNVPNCDPHCKHLSARLAGK